MSDLDQFNKTMLEFIDQLSLYNNKNVNFSTYKNIATACIMANKRSVNEIFNRTVTIPYSAEILKKNERFFLDLDEYTSEYENDISFINYLKHIWCLITTDDKSRIWDFLNVLVFLDKKVNI